MPRPPRSAAQLVPSRRRHEGGDEARHGRRGGSGCRARRQQRDSFGGLKLESISNDDIFATAGAIRRLIALPGGRHTATRQDAVARVGDNVEFHTGTLEIEADHQQSVDARAMPWLRPGRRLRRRRGQPGAGPGGRGDRRKLHLFASDIFIDAKNILTKERFKNGFNLSSGS